MRSPTSTAALVAALLLPCPAPAAVDDQSLEANALGGYAFFSDGRRYHGLLGGLDLAWVPAPFWAGRAGYAFGEHRSKGLAFRVHQVTAGVRYRLDVLEYVPWIEVGPGLYFSSGDDGPAATDYGFAFGAGLDWLMNPEWSLGAGLHYHRMFDEPTFPAYFDFAARLGYRWVLGDPFAP